MPIEKNDNHRILVIDDNPSIHEDFRKILVRREHNNDIDQAEAELFGEELAVKEEAITFELDSAMQGQEGFQKVQQANDENRPFSLAFVDMRMPPGWDGLKSIEEIWKIAPDLQVVICTAYSDHTWSDICDRLGHSDKLLILKKPFDDIEVSQTAIALTTKWALTQQAMIKNQELENLVDERTAQLKYAATHDSLTCLPNRTEFHERLRSVLKVNEQSAQETAVFLLDLDHFKNINDTLGHPVGDQVIRAVASRLQKCVRQTDTVARLGGDEFAIIQTPVHSIDDINSMGKRIHDAIEAPFSIDGHTVSTAISIGVAIAPEDGESTDRLLKNADLALYRAKDDGRSCLRFFESEMEKRMQARHEMELRLRQAMQNDEFVLHYQPLFNSDSEEVCCLEALIRWRDPVHGLVPPNKFVPVAEETGLILPLGDWVIQQACQDATRWPANIRVAVNVSAAQFANQRFLDAINHSLALAKLDPDRLEIEITETVLLTDHQATLNALHAIRDLGVRVVMDDFGTGYSSLSYLRSFPFDKLKIDMSFVRDSTKEESARAIVKTVASLGQCLNMETTAEGVETESQLAHIVDDGYTQFQGFLRGKPCPVDEIMETYFASSLVGHAKV